MQITNRWNGNVIYDAPEATTVYQAIIEALKSGADLSGAVLDSIPIVPNIDAAILSAIEQGGVLKMSDWHTCATTHCRAGWAITLAGEDGAKLETNIGAAAQGSACRTSTRAMRTRWRIFGRGRWSRINSACVFSNWVGRDAGGEPTP